LKSDLAYHSLASRMRRITQSVGDPHTFWLSAKDAAELGFTGSTGSKIPKIVASARDGVAMIAIPSFASGDDQSSLLFSDTLQLSIESLADGRPKAWIIDLRENEGGNMWPMIAGLNCFLNDGPLGFFRLASGQDVKWKLEKNKVSLVVPVESNMAHPPETLLTREASQNILSKSAPPVQGSTSSVCKFPQKSGVSIAVLVSRKTASSAEALVIAFLSGSNAVIVGENTAGLATGNSTFPLSDGSLLAVTTSTMLSMDGRTFTNGIDPQALGARGIYTTKDATVDTLEYFKKSGVIGSNTHRRHGKAQVFTRFADKQRLGERSERLGIGVIGLGQLPHTFGKRRSLPWIDHPHFYPCHSERYG
jgi:C-terminal processing protease CtpA/Prc